MTSSGKAINQLLYWLTVAPHLQATTRLAGLGKTAVAAVGSAASVRTRGLAAAAAAAAVAAAAAETVDVDAAAIVVLALVAWHDFAVVAIVALGEVPLQGCGGGTPQPAEPRRAHSHLVPGHLPLHLQGHGISRHCPQQPPSEVGCLLVVVVAAAAKLKEYHPSTTRCH